MAASTSRSAAKPPKPPKPPRAPKPPKPSQATKPPKPSRSSKGTGTSRTPEPADQAAVRNDVVLWGRLSADAEERELPSGDLIVTLRVVVPRRVGPPRPRATTASGPRRPSVDTIDVVCWTAATRRAALRLAAGEAIEVEGSLRRRFFGAPVGRQSRYEVEAGVVRRLSGDASHAS